MNDVEKSELVIARILTLLMQWGIQHTNLKFEELELDVDDFGSFFFPCVDWLVAEGIIRVYDTHQFLDGPHSGLVDRPVLTSHGFRLLGHKLEIADKEETIGEAVKQVSAAGQGYSGFGDFVGGLLGGFTKSLGS